MRTSNYLLANLKENPTDAELTSHRLMLRAGMIRKLASGIYIWLPMGLRVLRKVEAIVRQEMDAIGAMEVLLPAVQPAELWQESLRWEQYGPELLRFHDRHQREFCFGPTHEEVITDLMRKELRSYKQLPCIVYQIQNKFRDEIRPRFGVMRGREFLMKDAYSFHLDETSLSDTYDAMFAAYQRIFTRLGLHFRAVVADNGAIGGSRSHEFQVLADSGEDLIVTSDSSNYAANIEKASCLPAITERPAANADMAPCSSIHASPEQQVKIILVNGHNDELVAIALRADHQLNTVKAEHHPWIAEPLQLTSEKDIQTAIGCQPESVGPVGLDTLGIPLIVDREAAMLADFSCAANENGKYWQNVNWGRDLAEPDSFELRNIVDDDNSPDGHGKLQLTRGIEVGHIFQLGDKYSQSMKATVLNENGQAVMPLMGCYGIGVSRIVAAAIEQHHDDYGIIWPNSMAPFEVVLTPMNYHKSHRVREYTNNLYQQLVDAGYEVLLDDRKERPGILFATADLLGIPHRLVISEKGIDAGTVEYKARHAADSELLKQADILSIFK